MRRAFAFLAITLVAACGAAPQPDRGDTAPSLAGAISSSSTTNLKFSSLYER